MGSSSRVGQATDSEPDCAIFPRGGEKIGVRNQAPEGEEEKMEIREFHPSVAMVKESGSYEAAIDMWRQMGRLATLPRGRSNGSIVYVTPTGRLHIAYGSYADIARLLRRNGYTVTRS